MYPRLTDEIREGAARERLRQHEERQQREADEQTERARVAAEAAKKYGEPRRRGRRQ
jgi:hypothetical protein